MFVRHTGWGVAYNGTADASTNVASTSDRGRMSTTGNVAMALGFSLGPALGGVAFAHLTVILAVFAA